MATYSTGVNAVQFTNHTGLTYETVFNLLHKLRSGMFDPDQSPLSGRVEVDETFIGGIRKGKRGRGALGKALVIGAMELRKHRNPKKGQSDYYVSRVRYRKIKDASAENIEGFIFDVIDSGSTILTDGFASYKSLDAWDYHHIDMNVRAKTKDDVVPHFHQEVGNLKAWLNGTFHGVSDQHLQTYLNEAAYKASWHYSPFEAWANMLRLVVSREGPTYEDIYGVKKGGEYAHINGFDFNDVRLG
jgi:transposase-like protein